MSLHDPSPTPLCAIARENGGDVPLACLFGCSRGCTNDTPVPVRGDARCNRCGSHDVRWRQQGGQWVLFSLKPGVVHVCAPDTSDFSEVK